MTDKASKYPKDFGDGIEYHYHIGKKEKIIICIMIGFGFLATYYFITINNQIKTNDWTLDPNTDWNCKKLNDYEKTMTSGFNSIHIPIPQQLSQNIENKRQDLGCQ